MSGRRLIQLGVVFGLFVLLVLGRLAQVQLLQHDRWQEEARQSRTRKRTLPFHRGRILDAAGRVLAEDLPSYDLHFEYRAFRRGHPAGQLYEALALLGEPASGLPAAMEEAEELGRRLLALRPADLQRLPARRRADLLFYLEGLAGLEARRTRERIEEWVAGEKGGPSFGEAFPSAWSGLDRRLRDARDRLLHVENILGLERGRFLEVLDQRRRDLERRLRREALVEAAARATESTVADVLEILLRERDREGGEDAGQRRRMLDALVERWQVRGSRILAGMTWPPPQEESDLRAWEEDLGLVLRQVERRAPEDLAGVRRMLYRDLHRNRVYRIFRDIPFDLVDLLAQAPMALPGLEPVEHPTRRYPEGVAPQLVGMVRETGPRDLREYQDLRREIASLSRLLHRSRSQEERFQELRRRLWRETLWPGESRGLFGVEFALEDVLRGKRGRVTILEGIHEEDRPLELEFVPPVPGQDVRLFLDAGLQRAAEAAIVSAAERVRERVLRRSDLPDRARIWERLRRPRAALVLLDLRDGSVPVCATWPSYLPEDYRSRYRDLVADPARPLRIRGLGGGFSMAQTPYPGSTFKLVVAAAALRQDASWWDREYECTGSYAPRGHTRALHCEGVHGRLTMRRAIVESCNAWFYQAGEDLGYETLFHEALALGFGASTGLDLLAATDARGRHLNAVLERGANFLTPPEDLGRDYHAALQTAIGQVHVHASPLQMARFYGWLASGRLWQPRIVQEEGGRATQAVWTSPALPAGERRRLLEAMRAVVEDPRGTAFNDADPARQLARFRVAGKTGTAQTPGREEDGPALLHAWFAGVFPWDEPRYAVAVFCENCGLHGGDLATEVLWEFLDRPEAAPLLGEEAR